ncbi:MAG: bacteriohopanetetrol glucosamine biosynthesis glycosyltransferase HpnI [Candidatus Baltobacteraceae bacterium]
MWMLREVLYTLSVAALLASLAGIGYLILALLRVALFRNRPESGGAYTPPVTVMKPLRGLESQLYENLLSFCDQDYPVFQVVFGVQTARDPAVSVVERVIAAFPGHDFVLAVGGSTSVENPKVANLKNMVDSARHDILIVSDADMRVDRVYLRSVVKPFAAPNVGAVTAPYAGVPIAGIASVIGAMFINDQFTPSVLVALVFERLQYCFGSTMGVRRAVLDAIGGFGALGDYLADDYMLGKLVSDCGYAIVHAPYVVRNIVADSSISSLWFRQLRWARTIRALRPVGYSLSFLTYGFSMALLYLAVSRDLRVGLALLFAAGGLEVALHYAARRAFQTTHRAVPWLAPVRDLLGFAVWIASFFGRGVRWHHQEFSLEPGGSHSRFEVSR